MGITDSITLAVEPISLVPGIGCYPYRHFQHFHRRLDAINSAALAVSSPTGILVSSSLSLQRKKVRHLPVSDVRLTLAQDTLRLFRLSLLHPHSHSTNRAIHIYTCQLPRCGAGSHSDGSITEVPQVRQFMCWSTAHETSFQRNS